MVKKKNISIKPLIIDHNLRKESSDEAIRAKKLLKYFGLNSFIHELDGYKKTSGLQEWARNERLNALTSITEKEDGILALGHHLNDQVETLMMRMFKNTGFRGAEGIRPIIFWNNIPIIRPLLNYTKTKVLQTCKKHNLAFLLDPSNKNKTFERVRTRSLISKFKGEDLNFNQLNRFCTSIRKINTYIDNILNPIINTFAPINIFGWCSIDPEWFVSLQDSMAKKVLSNRIRIISGSIYPAERSKVNNLLEHIKDYKKNINQIPGRTISGTKFKYWKKKFVLVRLPTKKIVPVRIPIWGRIIFDGRWEVKCNEGLVFNYLNKEQCIEARKIFDPYKKLPHEIWSSVPFLENTLNLNSPTLEEEINNTHIISNKNYIENISTNDSIRIKFLDKKNI